MKLNAFKMKQLKSISKQSQSGFTLVEMIVAILAGSLFVLGALQAMVLATFVQVRAREEAEALLAIQEDLEEIRAAAARSATSWSPSEIAARCAAPPDAGVAAGIAEGIGLLAGGWRGSDLSNLELKASQKAYAFVRTLEPDVDASGALQSHILRVTYKVTEEEKVDLNSPTCDADKEGRCLAELYTEVLADAVFTPDCN